MIVQVDQPEKLFRYTSLPVLVKMLSRKQIELLSPMTWEDRNDSYFLEQYKLRRNLSALLALCFTTKAETFHQWKIFAGNSAGVCIHFDASRLLKSLPIVKEPKGKSSLISKFVDYKYIDDVRYSAPDIENWPFVKRKPFEDEGEYRLVYQSETHKAPTKRYRIDIDCIKCIKLSPWMPEALSDDVKTLLKTIDGCSGLDIQRSQLIETPAWKAAIRKK